jgi:hypothetical protein
MRIEKKNEPRAVFKGGVLLPRPEIRVRIRARMCDDIFYRTLVGPIRERRSQGQSYAVRTSEKSHGAGPSQSPCASGLSA